MKIKRIISLLSTAAIAGTMYVPVGAAESWTEYTAAYDRSGRLVSVQKSSDVNPSDVDTMIDFKQLKTFVWNTSNEPYADKSSVILNAEDFKAISSTSDGVYKLEMNDTYNISADADLYVNGYKVTEGIDSFFNAYVSENTTGKLKLADIPEEGTSEVDGIYNAVYVSYYAEGVVDDIDQETGRIYFKDCSTQIYSGKMELNENTEYSIKFNGKEITLDEIIPGDVLTISYDAGDEFRYSQKYEILVSRNKFTGQVSSIYENPDNSEDKKYIFLDGSEYRPSDEFYPSLKNDTIYDVYLDLFGRIVRAEENYSLKTYALLENVYHTNDGAESYVDIVGGDGIKTAYKISNEDYDSFASILMMGGEDIDAADKLTNRQAPQDRVIEYIVNSDGELKLKNIARPYEFSGEFDPLTGSLGGRHISEDLTSIINITNYNTNVTQGYNAVAYGSLKPQTEYTGYVYGADYRMYKFVLITKGQRAWHVNDPWAVFVQTNSIETDMGVCDGIDIMTDGQLRSFALKDGVSAENMKSGDIFFYRINDDYQIEEIRMVTAPGELSKSYQDFYEGAVNAGFDILDENTSAQFADKDGTVTGAFAKDNNKLDCELIAGPIVDVEPGSVYIVTPAALEKQNGNISSFEIDRCKEYYLADDVNVYLYDYSVKLSKDRVSRGAIPNIRKSSFNRDSYVGDKSDNVVDFKKELELIRAWSDGGNADFGNVNFAIAKMVEKEITEIMVIIPDSDI